MKINHEIRTSAVTFNILDPDQNAMYEHIMKRKNKSAYLKRLIQRDMEGLQTVQIVQSTEQIKEEASIDTDLMEGLI